MPPKFAALGALTLCAGSCFAQTHTWLPITDGFWNVPTNWSPTGAPINPSDTAIIPDTGIYTIQIASNISSAQLINTNPSATVHLLPTFTHQLFGDMTNDGIYRLESTSGNETLLRWESSATIAGSGMIDIITPVFTVPPTTTIEFAPGTTLTHEAPHTISGSGQLIADTLINNGTIVADGIFETLNILTDELFNNGTIQANFASNLRLDRDNMVIHQGEQGILLSNDGIIHIEKATIHAGSLLSSEAGGDILVHESADLHSVINNARIIVEGGARLNLYDTITNNAEIALPVATPFGAPVWAESDILLDGTGQIEFSDNSSSGTGSINTRNTFTLTNGPDHTIRGPGTISGSIVNNGNIIADSDVPDTRIMRFDGAGIENNANISITNGATLWIRQSTVNQSSTGIVDIQDGLLELEGTISGGIINAGPNASILVKDAGDARLINTTITPPIMVPDRPFTSNPELTLGGTIINNNTITLNPTKDDRFAEIQLIPGTHLNGTGTIQSTQQGSIDTTPGAVVTQGPDHTIRGGVQILVHDFINEGLIAGDQPGEVTRIGGIPNGSTFQNNNLISATNGATLEFHATGTLTQTPQARILVNDSYMYCWGTTFIGGAIEALGTGYMEIQQTVTFQDITLDIPITLIATGNFGIRGTVVNNNTITLEESTNQFPTKLILDTNTELQGTGSIDITGSEVLNDDETQPTLTNTALHTLAGHGTVETHILNHGTIEPTPHTNPLTFTSGLDLTETSTIRCAITDENTAAGIRVLNSELQMDGTLSVVFENSFNPDGFWSATVVSANNRSGAFTAIEVPQPTTPGYILRIDHLEDAIKVGHTCEADLDFSGENDFFDLSLFLSLLSTQDPIADIDHNGEYDFFDITAFLQLFTNGCGS